MIGEYWMDLYTSDKETIIIPLYDERVPVVSERVD